MGCATIFNDRLCKLRTTTRDGIIDEFGGDVKISRNIGAGMISHWKAHVSTYSIKVRGRKEKMLSLVSMRSHFKSRQLKWAAFLLPYGWHISIILMAGINLTESGAFGRIQHMCNAHQSQKCFILCWCSAFGFFFKVNKLQSFRLMCIGAKGSAKEKNTYASPTYKLG